MIYILEDENAFAEKMKEAGNKLVVIDFYADWCNPCQTVAKWYKDLPEQYPDVIFCKVKVDDAEDLVEKFNITTIPRILLFKDGKQIEIQDNNNDKNTLKKNIDLYKEVQCASNTK
ncbi:thioredoxin-like isoform X1 [Chiloscyllium plagiosum]|uniref:thioredoxin-like isoform X1 n=1 Tax=Chiloscyllium plagiosum TaxID=36176 RepID=UPI001CB7D708|nr:thioredoxin-like isoform X1 [Chiloscyllium plagiosum]